MYTDTCVYENILTYFSNYFFYIYINGLECCIFVSKKNGVSMGIFEQITQAH